METRSCDEGELLSRLFPLPVEYGNRPAQAGRRRGLCPSEPGSDRFRHAPATLPVIQELLVLPDFVVSQITKKIAGMEAQKSSTLWSDEQPSFGEAAPIPWEQAYLRAVRE